MGLAGLKRAMEPALNALGTKTHQQRAAHTECEVLVRSRACNLPPREVA